jgi:ketopantoate reductase
MNTQKTETRTSVLIVGAGAVGRLLGCLLHQAGYQVTFVLRPGRELQPILARDLDRRSAIHRLEQPATVVAGQATHTPDLVIVAVRSDQVDDAFLLARTYLGPASRLAVVPPLIEGLAARLRAAGIHQPACTMLVAFGAWPVGTELHWFRFPGAACLVAGDGDPHSHSVARQTALDLRRAGLRARAFRTMPAMMRCFLASELARYLGWELAGWDVDRLAHDPELGPLTARAMADAIAVTAPSSGLIGWLWKAIPAGAHRWLLQLRARFMSSNMRAIWRYHGPKVSAQTRFLVDALLAEADRRQVDASALRLLRDRAA